jgi:hypothetical protein
MRGMVKSCRGEKQTTRHIPRSALATMSHCQPLPSQDIWKQGGIIVDEKRRCLCMPDSARHPPASFLDTDSTLGRIRSASAQPGQWSWIGKSFASRRLRLSTAQMEESSIKRIVHACYECGFGRAKKKRQGSHLLRLCHSSDRLRLR